MFLNLGPLNYQKDLKKGSLLLILGKVKSRWEVSKYLYLLFDIPEIVQVQVTTLWPQILQNFKKNYQF